MATADSNSLYRDEFLRHMDAGDDPENARLRIIEQGCPIELAAAIEKELSEGWGEYVEE